MKKMWLLLAICTPLLSSAQIIHEPTFRIDNHEGQREGVIVDMYSEKDGQRIELPFYRSTGNNSKSEDTFFPFIGLAEKGENNGLIDSNEKPSGTVIKPLYSHHTYDTLRIFKQNFLDRVAPLKRSQFEADIITAIEKKGSSCYSKTDIDAIMDCYLESKQEGMTKSYLVRFGTIGYAMMSYMFHTGVWESHAVNEDNPLIFAIKKLLNDGKDLPFHLIPDERADLGVYSFNGDAAHDKAEAREFNNMLVRHDFTISYTNTIKQNLDAYNYLFPEL